MISRYIVRPIVNDSGRGGQKYAVEDQDTGKIVSRHISHAVALRHCDKLDEQTRKHAAVVNEEPAPMTVRHIPWPAKVTPMPKPAEYKHLAAWGALLHSNPGYVREQQALASFDAAPIDAVFKRDGKWVRYADVVSAATRAIIDRWLAEHDQVNGATS